MNTASRRGVWLLCLGLLLGPIGPGGAWHVARADVLSAQTGAAAVAVESANHSAHAGTSCLACHLLHGPRAVLPQTAGVVPATTCAATVLPRPTDVLPSANHAPAPSRAPPSLPLA